MLEMAMKMMMLLMMIAYLLPKHEGDDLQDVHTQHVAFSVRAGNVENQIF